MHDDKNKQIAKYATIVLVSNDENVEEAKLMQEKPAMNIPEVTRRDIQRCAKRMSLFITACFLQLEHSHSG